MDVALQHVKIAIPEIQIGKRILPKAYHKTEGAFVTEFLAKGPDLVACLDGLLKSYGGGDWDVRHSDDGIGCHAVWNREDQPLLDIDYLTWAFVELIHEESLSSGWE